MKEVKVIISRCSVCPFCDPSIGRVHEPRCRETHRLIAWEDILQFPEWCPLPDVKALPEKIVAAIREAIEGE